MRWSQEVERKVIPEEVLAVPQRRVRLGPIASGAWPAIPCTIRTLDGNLVRRREKHHTVLSAIYIPRELESFWETSPIGESPAEKVAVTKPRQSLVIGIFWD